MKEMDKYIIAQPLDSLGMEPLYVGVAQAIEGQSTAHQVGSYGDPNFAMVFPNQKSAQQFMLEEINFNHGQVVTLAEALQRWEKASKKGFFRRNFLKVSPENKTPMQLTGNHKQDQLQLLKWWLEAYNPTANNTPDHVYKAHSSLSYQLFKFLMFSGYDARTLQEGVTIKFEPVPKPSDIPIMAAEVAMAVAFIKPVDGQKIFAVMEPTLSQFESYVIQLKEEVWQLRSVRGSRDRTICSSENLEKFLLEVQQYFKPLQVAEENEI